MRLSRLSFSNLAASLEGEVESNEVAVHQLDAVLVRSMPPGSVEQIVFRMDVLHELQAQGIGHR